MSNIIDSIQLSGVTYQIQGSGGGGVPESTFTAYTATTDERISQDEEVTAAGLNALNDKITPTVELTQAEYDALTTKDPNTYYIITDAQAGDLTNYYTKSETNTLLGGKQATLVSGTNIKTINNESILGSGNIDIQGGGGKAVSGGTNISITTGETADTINCTLPISVGRNTIEISKKNIKIGTNNTTSNNNRVQCAIGENNTASGIYSFAFGVYSNATNFSTVSMGYKTTANNQYQASFGRNPLSSVGSSTFGDSGNTLFVVGNATGNNDADAHNAFEIRQNGDIYLSSGGTDIKLQDHLGGGGGGSSYTAGDGIDITNDVISVTGKVDASTYNTYTAATDTALASKADTSAVTAIQDSLSGYVTTNTEQAISGRKIFTYTSSSNKAIEFKQTDDYSKVGFSIKNPASTNNEVASFEFRPNTFTIDNVQHPLLYFGHYRNTKTANAGVPQTVIGFRQYDQVNAAAYHYLMPLPEKAKTSFGLTTSFKDYYAPMGFKNGSTMITADNTGVVDLSSELGGLKLKKLTQAEYDALATKNSNTLYVIVN